MRKIQFLLYFILLFNFSSFAQPNTEIRYGIKVGGNFTGEIFDKTNFEGNRKLIPNFHIGGIFLFPVNQNFSIQPEILFVRNGFKFTDSNPLNNGLKTEVTQRVSYLQIPLLFNYKFTSIDPAPYILAGAYWGYAVEGTVKSKTKYSDGIVKSSRTLKFGDNAPDYFQRVDAGISVGAGIDFELMLFEIRYSQSILSKYADPVKATFSANSNLALSITIFL